MNELARYNLAEEVNRVVEELSKEWPRCSCGSRFCFEGDVATCVNGHRIAYKKDKWADWQKLLMSYIYGAQTYFVVTWPDESSEIIEGRRNI